MLEEMVMQYGVEIRGTLCPIENLMSQLEAFGFAQKIVTKWPEMEIAGQLDRMKGIQSELTLK